ISAWKQGQVYEYQIQGRTLAALHDVADQYTGTIIKATLKVQPRNQDSVLAWVTNARHSDVHANLTNGWNQEIPDKYLNYQNWQLSDKPFAIQFKNGVVKNLQVSQNLPTWELNIIKSIVSQLQVDTRAENEVSSRLNQKPKNGKPFGTFKTMEDTVTGECETLYDIKPLQQVEQQNKPQLAPMPNLKGSNGDLIDIIKTKNFSRCDSRIEYHFGLPGSNDVEPSSNQVLNFLSRSSTSRVIIAGDLSHYTIQSSVTTDKIVISPELYNKQKGMVVSRLNVTLSNVHSAAQNNAPALPSNVNKVDDLIYEYNPASPDNESAQNNNGKNNHHNDDD
ncbi:vitellogenin-like, partial [Diaphorina citri]|uniref:Vitellogenin-like n=1 Tax=Diaphorina citri TaxID=121845 RepID=A0A3Q0J235_DIACI